MIEKAFSQGDQPYRFCYWLEISIAFLLLFAAGGAARAADPDPVAWWSFDGREGAEVLDEASGRADKVEGHFKRVPGVKGKALRFDGYTTELTRPAEAGPGIDQGFTIEGFVAAAAYPWNWCPIVGKADAPRAGYTLMLGSRGQISLRVRMGEEWKTCTTKARAVPLRKWTHVAAACDPEEGLKIYVNGQPAAEQSASGPLRPAENAELRIGIIYSPKKPDHIHRKKGTLPTWWTLDGQIDELRLYDRTLNAEQVRRLYDRVESVPEPHMPPRRMPSGPDGPGRFGAYYTRLRFYEQWDALWRVGPDPDVLVRFDNSPVRVVFWRGTRYSPAWVSGNDQWMADQSVEAWTNKGPYDDRCFEHMQDRFCRYSHVRIIESNPARVVVHWRYAPVCVNDQLWNEHPKTGRACRVDEYYTIYPDAMGVRRVAWDTGSLGGPHQFQESLPLTHPGQLQSDVIHKDFAWVANLQGKSEVLSFARNPEELDKDFPENPTMQIYNFRSPHKPFIIFERGNKMHYVKDRRIGPRGLDVPGACNHWPVGQASCDGRTVQAADRPTHFLGFPISYPPVHEEDGRSWWAGLYGMTDLSIEELVPVARSWNLPPRVEKLSKGYLGHGFDRGQSAYVLVRKDEEAGELAFRLAAGEDRPAYHPAFVVKGWGEANARIVCDGKSLAEAEQYRAGLRRRPDRTDLVVWLNLEAQKPLKLQFQRREE